MVYARYTNRFTLVTNLIKSMKSRAILVPAVGSYHGLSGRGAVLLAIRLVSVLY